MFAECHNAEHRYIESRYAECCFTECRYSECCYTDCRYTECPGARKNGGGTKNKKMFHFERPIM
jgi:hypothetical protein